jgi:hypothetical protein
MTADTAIPEAGTVVGHGNRPPDAVTMTPSGTGARDGWTGGSE